MIVLSSHPKLVQHTAVRSGETKLGQRIRHTEQAIQSVDQLKALLRTEDAPYVIVGIPEDVGVRANGGNPGTCRAYDNFLSYFVNIQANQFYDGRNVFLLGEINVTDIQEKSLCIQDVEKLRELCASIDTLVSQVIKAIVESGKIPIVIGGGHNNAYGNIKGTSSALNRPIEVLNIDPHADFRIEEGRHSGNGFRYAYNENYLKRYGIWGLHESYNNQAILNSFSNNSDLFYETFDNLLRGQALPFEDFLTNFSDEIALELDLDSIKNMPSSAKTPIGFSEEDIIRQIYQISKTKRLLYYHFTEGIPNDIQPYTVGKFLAYLVTMILKQG